MKKPSRSKSILSLILLAILICATACASQRIGSSSPATTTVVTNDFGETVYPCIAPEGYSYPENANPIYEEFGIWLSEDFNRPDLIWVDDGMAAFYVDMNMTKPGTISYAEAAWNVIGSDTDRFAVTLRELGENYDLDKLIEYLTDLGWESLSAEEPLFAATRDQINALDCIDLETYLGQTTSTGFALFCQYQAPHTHDPIEGEENCRWNCLSELNVYISNENKSK